MPESTPRSRCYFMPILLLFLYTNSCTWCFLSDYTGEQCPAGIIDVLEKCRCRQTSRGIYVICKLQGSTYRQLPALGQVNATIWRLTLENATVHRVPGGAFANLTVSTCMYLCLQNDKTSCSNYREVKRQKYDTAGIYSLAYIFLIFNLKNVVPWFCCHSRGCYPGKLTYVTSVLWEGGEVIENISTIRYFPNFLNLFLEPYIFIIRFTTVLF